MYIDCSKTEDSFGRATHRMNSYMYWLACLVVSVGLTSINRYWSDACLPACEHSMCATTSEFRPPTMTGVQMSGQLHRLNLEALHKTHRCRQLFWRTAAYRCTMAVAWICILAAGKLIYFSSKLQHWYLTGGIPASNVRQIKYPRSNLVIN